VGQVSEVQADLIRMLAPGRVRVHALPLPAGTIRHGEEILGIDHAHRIFVRRDPAGIFNRLAYGNGSQGLGVYRSKLVHQTVPQITVQGRGHRLGSLIQRNGIEWAPEKDEEGIVQVIEKAAASFRSPDRTFPGQGIKLCCKIIGITALQIGKFLQLCRLEGKAG